MSKDPINEIIDHLKLGKPVERRQFDAAKLYWTERTKGLDLALFQASLVTFLSCKDEVKDLLLKDMEEDEPKFVSVGDLEFARRGRPAVMNLGEVKLFEQILPEKLATVTAESRRMAREMLAVLLPETCYANNRQSCLNPWTDELAESLYPELKGKLSN